MKVPLTPFVLGFLIEQQYAFVLSKTNYSSANGLLDILLTPTQKKPLLKDLPQEYDTYFRITREPMQMTAGIEGAEVSVYLNLEDAEKLSAFFGKEIFLSTSSYEKANISSRWL